MSDLKYAIRITGDASSLRQATSQGEADLARLGDAAARAAGKANAAAAAASGAGGRPNSGGAANVVPFPSAISVTGGLRPDQVANLRSQLLDIGTSLSGGASPLQVLSQQGAQVYEAIAGQKGFSAGLKAARTSAIEMLGAIGPASLAIGGLATSVGAAALAYGRLSSNQRDVALGVAGSGRASGTSAADINRFADANSSIAGGVSAQTLREMGTEFARTGKIGVAMYGDLSRLTRDFATLTGTDLPEASRTIADAFAGESNGALKLNEVIGGLDGRTLRLMQTMEAAGDRIGVQRLMVATFGDALRVAGENVGIFTKLWEGAKAAASQGADFIGKQVAIAVQGGTDLPERLAKAQQILASSKAREGYLPFIGPRDTASAQAQVDDLTKLVEREAQLRQSAVSAQKTLEGKRAVDALVPTIADLTQLETFRSRLRDALDTGQAASGTESALKRVSDLLKAGGTEAYNLQRAAQLAFDTATLLPFEATLVRIRREFDEKLKTADPQSMAGLLSARNLETGAATRAALGNPVRDANLGLAEQIANLRVQRESFLAGSEAAATMAAKQDLINGYLRAGVTDWQRNAAAIDAYAASMGKAKAADEEFQRVRSNIVGGMDELRSGGRGIATGIFSDLRQGRNPAQGLASGLGGIADRLFDRTVSRPATEYLLGQDGKGGGGILGDGLSKLFGSVSTVTTPVMNVTAATVALGGVGGLGGLTATSAAGGANPAGLPDALAGGAKAIRLPSAADASAADLSGVRPWPTASVTSAALPEAGPSLLSRMGFGAVTPLNRSGIVSGSLDPSSDRYSPLQSGLEAQAAKMASAGDGVTAALDETKSGISTEGSGLVGTIGSLVKSLGSAGGLFDFGGPAAAATGGGTPAPSFDVGGFTGHGGRLEPAGVVHRGEYVFDAFSTRAFGVDYLEGMRRGARRGFAGGGFAGGALVPSAAIVPAGGGSESVVVHHAPVYHVQPAAGVTPEQLTAVMDQNNKRFAAQLPALMRDARGRGR